MRTSIYVREALKADGVGHSFRHYRKFIHKFEIQIKRHYRLLGYQVQKHVWHKNLNQIFPR